MSYTYSETGKQSMSLPKVLVLGAAGLFVAFGGIGGCMWGYPKYKVYSAEMHGRAVLAEAESSRQVAVREAQAVKDSSKFKAEAEVIRARGVADANTIIANGLGGPEGYLRYLAIDGMKDMARSNNTTVVYVPTDGNIPVTEATRFNKPESRTE